jgi:hypothetical protein
VVIAWPLTVTVAVTVTTPVPVAAVVEAAALDVELPVAAAWKAAKLLPGLTRRNMMRNDEQ